MAGLGSLAVLTPRGESTTATTHGAGDAGHGVRFGCSVVIHDASSIT